MRHDQENTITEKISAARSLPEPSEAAAKAQTPKQRKLADALRRNLQRRKAGSASTPR